MLAALTVSQTEWMLFVPCDVPGFPINLAETFLSELAGRQALYARDPEREHPTLCLLNRNLIPALKSYLENGDRKLMIFFHNVGAKSVMFNHAADFSNLNYPQDVLRWQSESR